MRPRDDLVPLLPVTPHGHRLVCVAGPAAGRTWGLERAGVLGRADDVDLRVADALLEPRHVAVEQHPAGLRVEVLAGAPLALARGGMVHRGPGGAVVLAGGCTFELGASRFRVDPPCAALPVAATPAAPQGHRRASAGIALHRPPRIRRAPAVLRVRLPPERNAAPAAAVAGPVAAVAGLAGTVVIAVAMRQPMFLLFGLAGCVAAIGTWGVALRRAWRMRRAERSAERADRTRLVADLAVARAAARAAYLAGTVDLADCRAWIDAGGARLWEQRGDHDDAFTVCLGIGDVCVPVQPIDAGEGTPRWDPLVEQAALLAGVAVPIGLGPASEPCIVGDPEAVGALARSLIVQLAAVVLAGGVGAAGAR